jgi:hypothetical protein
MSRKMKERQETPFAGLDVPGPPKGLRESVLGKAREALAREPVSDSWTRIWESRPARVAWVTCVVGLVVANLAVPFRPSGAGDAPRIAADDRPAIARDEVAELARLPRLDVGLLGDASAESDEEENS